MKYLKRYDYAFALISERDVDFFLNAAQALGKSTLFISFFQPGNNKIKAAGFDVFDIYRELESRKYDVVDVSGSSLNFEQLINHESLAFQSKTAAERDGLKLKAVRYFNLFFDLLNQIEINIVLQELGGFIGPLTLYNAALKTEVRHIFIEPSPVKGRMFLIENALSMAPLVSLKSASVSSIVEAKKYVEESLSSKKVVFSAKDRHHYQSSFTKLFKARNILSFSKKIAWKYFFGLKMEYQHPFLQLFKHLENFINAIFLRRFYANLSDLQNSEIIFFPFHVPIDFALTVRESAFVDQNAVIEKILSKLSAREVLIVKEHPAQIGAMGGRRLRGLLEANTQLRILDPTLNSYDVLSRAKACICINSKVGQEALCVGVPLFALGKPHYAEIPGVLKVRLNDFDSEEFTLDQEGRVIFDDIIWYLATMIENSNEFELYQNDEGNVHAFCRTLLDIERRR